MKDGGIKVNYLEFQKRILSTIKEILDINYEVAIEQVMKNNDVELVAVMIREKSCIEAVPTIYLEDFYEMYCAGVCMKDIANNIIAIYKKQKGKVNLALDDFMDFEKIKNKIMFKLINYERNQNGLQSMPHKRFLDLAIVFYVLWEESSEHSMTSVVRDSQLELWNIDVDALYNIAYENTMSKLSVEISSMRDIVYSIYKEMKGKGKLDSKMECDILDEMSEQTYPMYIITNNRKLLGAISILYDSVLKYFYEKFGGEYYILPSSIHEVIVIPKIEMTIDEIKKMVIEINENELDYLEILSDNVYSYDGKKISVAGE